MSDHVFLNKDGDVLTTIIDTNGMTDHLRHHRRAAAPGTDDLAITGVVGSVHLVQQVIVNKRSFFSCCEPLFSFPAADDEAAADLALGARLIALRLLTPRADRWTSARRATFTATVRVVHRVHSATSYVRLATHPAGASGFAYGDVFVFGVADHTHGCVALAVNAAEFATRQTQGDIVAVTPLNLDARAGAAGDLCALTGDEFDVVNDGADRDKAER